MKTSLSNAGVRAGLPIVVVTLLWGCNWPMLKIGVSEIPPLTFRGLTLSFAALAMLAIAKLSGDSVQIPRGWRIKVAILAFFNIALWNGFTLFGVQQMSAGRSVILAYTMPLWATLIATFMLEEPLSPRKLTGLVLGMAGMALLIGDEIAAVGRAPFGASMILIAALSWGFGTVLLRKWRPPIPQRALSFWLMMLGWIPLAALVPVFDPQPIGRLAQISGAAWFALLYNIFLSGAAANWAWFILARTLPVAVSSLASLPVPVVGVISGMVLLGERPRLQEWLALGLVVVALFIVLFQPRSARSASGN
ncbi:MAG TPA: DMT family transporter [Casimicrobiaceae bacterium]|nr:DMT family transporter [Casimicrobiaceae bacterium]